MPRVLRIINRLNIGGPTHNVGLLTKYLTDKGYETLLLSGIKDESEASSDYLLESMGITAHYVPNMRRAINPLNDIFAYRYLLKIIAQFKPHIVHTHAAKAGALGRLAAHVSKVPAIVHTFHGHVFHSYFGHAKTRFFLQTERRLAKYCHKVIALSTKQKHELANVYRVCPSHKIAVVPLGFNLHPFTLNQAAKRAYFRQYYNLPSNCLALGIVGRLTAVKNHAMFLKAYAAALPHLKQPACAFIIGNGELLASLQQLVTNLNLTWTMQPYDNNFNPDEKEASLQFDDNSEYTNYPDAAANLIGHQTQNQISTPQVIFTSWAQQMDVVYAGLDVIALTSFNEGTPVSLIEAQAASKPIISVEAGGIADIVLPNKTAVLVPNNNQTLFTEQLIQLLNNLPMQQYLAQNGQSWALEHFHFNRLINNMDALYQEIIAQNKIDITN